MGHLLQMNPYLAGKVDKSDARGAFPSIAMGSVDRPALPRVRVLLE